MHLAVRQLRRNPMFSVVTTLTLALGVGASTLIFSVINAVLVEPLPYPEPYNIVRLHEVTDEGGTPNLSDPNFYDLKQQSDSFAALAHFESTNETITGGDETARAGVSIVSGEFIGLMGVAPVRGRDFVTEEKTLGGAPAALISYRYWQRYLGGREYWSEGSTNVALTIGEHTYSVVGVMPRGFDYPDRSDVWVPRELLHPIGQSRTGHALRTVGRLAAGVSLEVARAELGGIAARLKALHGDDTDMVGVSVIPLHEFTVGSARAALAILAVGAALLLVVANANVANMLLARSVTRNSEFSIRVALGADRVRLASQYFAEMLMLGIIASVLALWIAGIGVNLLQALQPDVIPRAEGIRIDWQAAVFAVGLSVAMAATLSGLVASRVFSANLVDAIKPQETRRDHRHRWPDRLVAVQVAVALVLVIGVILLVRTYANVAAVDPGFRLTGGLLMNVATPSSRDPDSQAAIARYYDELIARLSAISGVVSVGAVTVLPLEGDFTNGTFVTLNDPDEVHDFAQWSALADNPARRGYAEFRLASGTYFSTLGIPLVRGRVFNARDGVDAPQVGVISESLAAAQWPGEDPIGKLINYGGMDGDLSPITIVGVVGDVRDYGLDEPIRPTFYASYSQRSAHLGRFWIVIDASDRESVIPVARSVVRELSPDWPPEFRFSEDLFSASVATRRFNLVMIGVFGGAALLLALVGIYGAMTFNVAQRVHEIGIRMALGAAANSVAVMVMRRSIWIACVGALAGLFVAFLGSRLIESLLFGVAPYDPVSYLLATALVIGLACAAAWIPARRAAGVDPMIALRSE